MKPAVIIILSSVAALSAMTWYGYRSGQFENITPMTPADHYSTLSDKEYANPNLREKDIITRMTPRMTEELTAKQLYLGDPVFIRIFKESRELEIWVKHRHNKKFHHFKTWKIAAMSGKLGPKTAEGDRQAPEGFYHVNQSQMRPDSNYHVAFNLGYPNAYDLAHNHTGSFIMVHGKKASAGCYAMTDPSMEEIYTICSKALSNGQTFFRVHVFPFRMTKERLSQETNHPWYAFWQNLKQGYDWFENKKRPPSVIVENKQYAFR